MLPDFSDEIGQTTQKTTRHSNILVAENDYIFMCDQLSTGTICVTTI